MDCRDRTLGMLDVLDVVKRKQVMSGKFAKAADDAKRRCKCADAVNFVFFLGHESHGKPRRYAAQHDLERTVRILRALVGTVMALKDNRR